MRTLYHFPTSPFARRTRLALAHKQIDFELRDARANPSDGEAMRKLWPLRTAPVFVDGDRVIGDSTAITHYLDREYSAHPLWAASGAFAIAALVDGFLNPIVDVGTRYYDLKNDPAWASVTKELLGRANGAAQKLADLAKNEHLTRAGWCAADMWLYTMVAWFEGLPARTAGNKNVTQIVSLGVTLPPRLIEWAARHDDRADVRAL